MRTEIKKLDSRDLGRFKDLLRVFEDVFEMEGFTMPGDRYLQQLLERQDFFAYVALQDNQVAAGLTAYMLQQYYSALPLVYIYDLAVKREFQRQGLGKSLIKSVTDYSKEIGAEEVFVQADEPDVHALEFYRSTGAREEKVLHFSYPLITAGK